MQHRHKKVKMKNSPWMCVTQMGADIWPDILYPAGLFAPWKNG
jgi:hypothetical protein